MEFLCQVGERVVAERSRACGSTALGMGMELVEETEAMRWLSGTSVTGVATVSDCQSVLRKVQDSHVCHGPLPGMDSSHLQGLCKVFFVRVMLECGVVSERIVWLR